MSKKIAFIPARSGSKRIKNKNIFKLNGKPLLYYAIAEAKRSKIFDKIILVTDSKKYAKIGGRVGALVPKLRPKYTAKDNSPDIEWVEWIADTLKLDKGDIFFILRPTSPFRTNKTIKRAWDKFKKFSNQAHSLRAVELCTQHPGKMWKLDKIFMRPLLNNKINKVPFHSNQYKMLPKIYSQNACIEISKVENIYKKRSISGTKIVPFLTNKLEGIDINNEEDLLLAKKYQNFLNTQNS